MKSDAMFPWWVKWAVTTGLLAAAFLCGAYASARLLGGVVATAAAAGALCIVALVAWVDWWLDYEHRRAMERYHASPFRAERRPSRDGAK